MCVPVCVVLGGKNTRESGQDLSRVSVTINPKVEKFFFYVRFFCFWTRFITGINFHPYHVSTFAPLYFAECVLVCFLSNLVVGSVELLSGNYYIFGF